MSLWKKVPSGRNPPEIINVIIETPKDSKNKYEVSKEYDFVYLDRVLHSSVVYPIAYGLVPRTYFDDGDPVDAMVLLSEPTFPGCVVEARPVGVLRMKDEKGVDDKVLCVATGDPRNKEIHDLDDLPHHFLDEIAEFFRTYKRLEEGKHTEVLGWDDREKAIETINYSLQLFRNQFGYK
ncbi:MAG: Inorganic pyrophosphatase [Methanomassiliicoccales archaeon PtaU1.Bin124]|nr:MAG: Inorganic pyrophosphatase [Methanomassiliicoccales archaeon PtaU1.Bin124]